MILAADPRLIFPLSLTAKDATAPAAAAVMSEAELPPAGGCAPWRFVALLSRCSSCASIHHCCCLSVEKHETLSLRGSKNLSVGRIGQSASSAEIKCAPAAMFSTLLCSVALCCANVANVVSVAARHLQHLQHFSQHLQQRHTQLSPATQHVHSIRSQRMPSVVEELCVVRCT